MGDVVNKEIVARKRPFFWLNRIFAVSFGVLLAWFLLEIFIRISFPILPYLLQAPLRNVYVTPFSSERILPPQVWQDDSEFQLVSRPHVDNELQYPDARIGFHVSTKNQLDPQSHVGFRVPSLAWEPQWPIDAIFLGDSFTFCYTEFEACWVELLSSQHGMSTINMGQVATGSISHLNILRKFGLLYTPQLVVWQWYGNDYNEDYGMAVKYQGLQPVSEDASEPKQPAESALMSWLGSYSAVYSIIAVLQSSEADLYKYTRFVDPHYIEADDLALHFGRPATLLAYDVSLEKNQIGMTLSYDAILDAQNLSANADIPFVVILMPTKEEVYQKWVEPVMGQDTVDSLSAGRLQMVQFCEQAGIVCFDTTAVLTAAANAGEQVYWPDDIHLNPRGNQIVADAVWDFFVEQQLVSP